MSLFKQKAPPTEPELQPGCQRPAPQYAANVVPAGGEN